jgi:hypothetical protein
MVPGPQTLIVCASSTPKMAAVRIIGFPINWRSALAVFLENEISPQQVPRLPPNSAEFSAFEQSAHNPGVL